MKTVAVLRRRPGMTHAEYSDYIREVHAALAIEHSGEHVHRYLQNHVFDSAYGATGDVGYQVPFPRDSVTELYMSGTGSSRALRDPNSPNPVGDDGVNFSDMPVALSVLVSGTSLPVPQPGKAPVKVLHFLKAADGLAQDEFQRRWREATEELLADPAGPARHLRAFQWNTAVPTPPEVTAYFGGAGQPSYDAYSALWLEEEGAVAAFREYEAAIEALAEKHGAAHQKSLSFVLLTREIVIIDRGPVGAP
jgi:hypothetical protein